MSERSRRGAARPSALRVAAVVGAIAIALFAAWRAGLFGLEDRTQLAAAIERARAYPHIELLFVVTYGAAAAVGVPATPFTLAGGALFGIGSGMALNWVGGMCAASLGFLIARATGLRTGGDRLAPDPSVAALSTARGAWMLFRLRLIPVVPFALLNAGAAVSGMSWLDFLVATGVGIIPIVVIYTISAAELVAGVAGSGGRALLLAFVSAGVLIALSFLPTLVRAFTRVRTARNARSVRA